MNTENRGTKSKAHSRGTLLALILTAVASSNPAGAAIVPVPEKVVCAVPDRQEFQHPDRAQLTGWLGTRIAANEANRLARPNQAFSSCAELQVYRD